MIFSVIISEKGGAERRESFDRAEINVGRVQGNDLMLPKGNVSKRHARLLFRDGRFIVNDLKSTNGTYVNGRKIVQATIVREGDKIYIGDFVLRIEAAPGAQLAPPQARSASGEFAAVAVEDAPESVPSPPGSVSHAKPTNGVLTGEHAAQDGVSHFPLENDPDEAPVPPAVPGPPRVPRPLPSRQSGSMIAPTAISSLPPATGAPPPFVPRPVGASSIPAPPQSPFPPPVLPVRSPVPPPAAADRVGSDLGTGPSQLHRAALALLVDRTAEALDLGLLAKGPTFDVALLSRITNELKERAANMQAAGHIPDGIAPAELVAEARRELCELGPLGALLADDDVIEVHIKDHERLIAYRKSRKQPTLEMPFTSEASVARTLRRLTQTPASAREDASTTLDRRTPEGLRIIAVSPSVGSKGHFVVIRKPQRPEASTMEDLVRSGLVSRAVATLLAQCIAGRTNILVTGAANSGHTALFAALAQSSTADERVVALQDDDEVALTPANALSIPLPHARADASAVATAALQMRPDRLIVGSFSGAAAAELVLGAGDSAGSLLASCRAPTMRHALSRLTADIAAYRPGMDLNAARLALAASFDVVLEVSRLRDGRPRLVRLAELVVDGTTLTARDIFTFNVERTAAGGAIEGSLQSTGTVPVVADDLAVRGVAIDLGIFRRGAPR